MSQLYLVKEFSEMDGLELCVVHWTVTRIGAAPDWQTARALVLHAIKRDGSSIRQGVLELDLATGDPVRWSLIMSVNVRAWDSTSMCRRSSRLLWQLKPIILRTVWVRTRRAGCRVA